MTGGHMFNKSQDVFAVQYLLDRRIRNYTTTSSVIHLMIMNLPPQTKHRNELLYKTDWNDFWKRKEFFSALKHFQLMREKIIGAIQEPKEWQLQRYAIRKMCNFIILIFLKNSAVQYKNNTECVLMIRLMLGNFSTNILLELITYLFWSQIQV